MLQKLGQKSSLSAENEQRKLLVFLLKCFYKKNAPLYQCASLDVNTWSVPTEYNI